MLRWVRGFSYGFGAVFGLVQTRVTLFGDRNIHDELASCAPTMTCSAKVDLVASAKCNPATYEPEPSRIPDRAGRFADAGVVDAACQEREGRDEVKGMRHSLGGGMVTLLRDHVAVTGQAPMQAHGHATA